MLKLCRRSAQTPSSSDGCCWASRHGRYAARPMATVGSGAVRIGRLTLAVIRNLTYPVKQKFRENAKIFSLLRSDVCARNITY